MARKKQVKGLKKITYGYRRSWQKRPFKVLYVLIFAGVFMWLGHFLFESHALTYPYQNSSAASSDLSHINNYRSGKGWSTLNETSCLNTIASNWAKKEAAANAISDPGSTWFNNQFNTYCSGHYWRSWGANDGVGPTDSGIFTAFLNSCEHLQNIADHGSGSTTVKTPNGQYCTFNSVGFGRVGTGAWVGSSGYLFVSEFFSRWYY